MVARDGVEPPTPAFSATLYSVLNNLSDFRWPPKYLRSRERQENRGWRSWVQKTPHTRNSERSAEELASQAMCGAQPPNSVCIPIAQRAPPIPPTAQWRCPVGCAPGASSSITSGGQSCDPLLSAENELGGAARNHVGRRVCPRSRNDLWHHGGVGHA